MNKIDSTLFADLHKFAERTGEQLYIDAGVAHLRLRIVDADGRAVEDETLPSNCDLKTLFAERGLSARFGQSEESPVFITGKLAPMVHQAIGGGRTFFHAATMCLAARERAQTLGSQALAMIEISASGYTLAGVDGNGQLKDDLLILNPRCGAGTGVNLDRVLQKLDLQREEVDALLADFLGEAGRERREKITTRADRCGVFGASATISDKNQGIPLAIALATTLKSETLKVCRKLPESFEHAVLLGRFFNWQYVRDCAEDHLRSIGVKHISYDPENTLILEALRRLVTEHGADGLIETETGLAALARGNEYPAFADLKATYEAPDSLRYHREASPGMSVAAAPGLPETPVHIGLDVGSTMAKVVMADDRGELLFLNAYSNAGDTIATVKKVFSELRAAGLDRLLIRSIGITGSARYQVRETLTRIYPELAPRIAVLVENYAHARGSIEQARQHLARLKAAGIASLNEDFCILVDIGGEDTKISTLALQEAELFNNAMNVKCSAGTGSLMDTLSALFGIGNAAEASQAAMNAPLAYEINATCAVFLLENAQKLQAQGVERPEILASASWAIVENMARTLWSQVELPANAVVLLHGQTMLSDPLPLAVTHRLQEYVGAPTYALVPTYPGHRACLGLIRSMRDTAPQGAQPLDFDALLDAHFEKRIIQCRGAACDDDQAVCNRTSLKCQGADGKHFSFTLGGCSAINELFAKSKDRKEGRGSTEAQAPVRDTYKEIWDFIDHHHPRSDDPQRLIIPRSFVVSEWAYFLSAIFTALGLPVHVDNVCSQDLNDAQPRFDIDSCAPHMGAVGQMTRLAGQPHGYILAPQIEMLPTGGKSMGRTCTLNQGGFAVARGLAQTEHPDARIALFTLDLSTLDAGQISDQLHDQLQALFVHYGIAPSRQALTAAIAHALGERTALRAATADLAADLIEETLAAGHRIALVVGREYLLNPGIYDSHIRRLLRDKQLAAIPGYILDIDLDESFGHIYWRNPHVITTILHAVAEKRLHQRILQPRLAAIFQELESSSDLLPIVQVSTFCCGPDSVTLPLGAELMKKRPFLLIQSDAIIKELAHLENRVNTYVRQLELGLHEKKQLGAERNFEVASLATLEASGPVDPARDVIYFPTLSDNRVLSSVMRAAGFTCIDNYADGFDLQANIKRGRHALGDAVCAPMAGVYADLDRACEDFSRRRAAGDPLIAGKTRLLFFDNAGTGPCRQGQYVEQHKLVLSRQDAPLAAPGPTNDGSSGCPSGAEAVVRFLVGREANGYNAGIEEWTMLRIYQGIILQGVLHDLLFRAATTCSNKQEFAQFEAEYLALKETLYARLEAFKGPGPIGRALVRVTGAPAKYFAYGLSGNDLAEPLRRFVQRWPNKKPAAGQTLSIHITGEVYMRVALSEDIFRALLTILGFGRFELHGAPIWSYFEYLVEENVEDSREIIRRTEARIAREGSSAAQQKILAEARAREARVNRLGWMLRHLIARPLYRAAGLEMPTVARETMEKGREILPTLRPIGELAPYLGEVLDGVRHENSLILNVAPTGCMVAAMGQVLTPRLCAGEHGKGQVQHLFSADGEINEELLAMAILKSLGAESFFVSETATAQA